MTYLVRRYPQVSFWVAIVPRYERVSPADRRRAIRTRRLVSRQREDDVGADKRDRFPELAEAVQHGSEII